MAHVVFLRAINVGGTNVFRPAALTAALASLDIVSIGAAGTFVVRGTATAAAIRRAILGRLPFQPRISVRPAREIVALVRSQPFRGVRFSKDVRGWVAALTERPKSKPVLPMTRPAGKAWSVRLDRVEGAFALGLCRRRSGVSVYPNPVVESALGVPATTRWWETIERMVEQIER
jgi:uncharacterized protein (DUF1697 family)